MARPSNPNSIYNMREHKDGKYRYAGTNVYTVGENGKRRYRWKHWGMLAEGFKFIPNIDFLSLETEERAKFIFPEGWDTSSQKAFPLPPQPGTPEMRYAFGREYGTIWLMEGVAKNMDIIRDLDTVLGSKEFRDSVLTLALHRYLTREEWDFAYQWPSVAKTPTERPLNPMDITRICKALGKKYNKDFFVERMDRIKPGDLIGVDSTTTSSYGIMLKDLRYCLDNKEGDTDKQQVKVILIYNLTTHEPVAYFIIGGNSPDVRSVEELLKALKELGYGDVVLITDRGYASLKNLQEYILKGQRVVTCLSTSLAIVRKCIDTILADGAGDPMASMSYDRAEEIYYRQFSTEYSFKDDKDEHHSCKDLRINIFVDMRTRVEELGRIRGSIDAQGEILRKLQKEGTPVESKADLARQCNLYDISFKEVSRVVQGTDDKGEKTEVVEKDVIVEGYSPKDKEIKGKRDKAGFFCISSVLTELEPMQCLGSYGIRDDQEKDFMVFKSGLGRRRPRSFNDECYYGRMFIDFIALIIVNEIGRVYRSSEKLRKKYLTPRHMVKEMATIRYYNEEKMPEYVTPFVGMQLEIAEAFGLTVPPACMPGPPAHRGKFTSVKDTE